MAKFKVVVSDDRHIDYELEKQVLSACDAELVVANCTTEEELLEACADADGILLNLAPMTAKVAQGLKKCKVISRYGVGVDNVDVQACTAQGIQVCNVPDYCAEDVSDLAIGLMFAAARRIPQKDRSIREGKWNLNYSNMRRIHGKVLSFIGFGRIARCFCQKATALGLKEIVFYDPFIGEEAGKALGARKVSFEEALALGDYVTLHIPATPENHHIINRETLSKMKSTAILINTARGALVCEEDLAEALNSGKLGGAALDTWETEPLPADSPFKTMDNCILTDHTGFNTEEALVELKTKCARNVLEILTGEKPTYPVNRF